VVALVVVGPFVIVVEPLVGVSVVVVVVGDWVGVVVLGSRSIPPIMISEPFVVASLLKPNPTHPALFDVTVNSTTLSMYFHSSVSLSDSSRLNPTLVSIARMTLMARIKTSVLDILKFKEL